MSACGADQAEVRCAHVRRGRQRFGYAAEAKRFCCVEGVCDPRAAAARGVREEVREPKENAVRHDVAVGRGVSKAVLQAVDDPHESDEGAQVSERGRLEAQRVNARKDGRVTFVHVVEDVAREQA